jgi:hypothetical protein
MHTTITQDHLPHLALQCVMDSPLEIVGLSHLYTVLEDWQKGELRRHPALRVMRDAEALESAVEAEFSALILIPADAGLPRSLIRSILARHPACEHVVVCEESTRSHVT